MGFIGFRGVNIDFFALNLIELGFTVSLFYGLFGLDSVWEDLRDS